MKDRKQATDEALKYLQTGGASEMIGLADMAWRLEQPKVQMDTELAIVLCVLAAERLMDKEVFGR